MTMMNQRRKIHFSPSISRNMGGSEYSLPCAIPSCQGLDTTIFIRWCEPTKEFSSLSNASSTSTEESTILLYLMLIQLLPKTKTWCTLLQVKTLISAKTTGKKMRILCRKSHPSDKSGTSNNCSTKEMNSSVKKRLKPRKKQKKLVKNHNQLLIQKNPKTVRSRF